MRRTPHHCSRRESKQSTRQVSKLVYFFFPSQDSEARKDEYLALARSLDGYSEISFPHCNCDARKEGHVVASVGKINFKLQACKEDGTLENQIIEFDWDHISGWEADEDGMAFQFEYARPDKKPRTVRIHTPYVSQYSEF